MWPFRKKDKGLEPPPPSLDEKHDFAVDNEKAPVATWAWAPKRGESLPTIGDQNRILVHWDRPPADENPEFWWQERNSDNRFRWQVEQQNGLPKPIRPVNESQGTPWYTNPGTSRMTNNMSPSSYSFTRPFDQTTRHGLTGLHSSMADQRRSYPIGGMNPVRRFRNTYRVNPPSRDAESMDMGEDQYPTAQPGIYDSPTAKPSPRSYRL